MSRLGDRAVQYAREQARQTDAGFRGAVDNRSDTVDVFLRCAGRLPANENTAGQAWCGMFVYWCYEQAATALGLPNPLPRATFGGQELWGWSRSPSRRAWVVWTPGQPYPALEPGDVFVVSDHSHVGMVAHANRAGAAQFQSVEGNQTDPAHRNWGNRGIQVKNADLNRCSVVVRAPAA